MESLSLNFILLLQSLVPLLILIDFVPEHCVHLLSLKEFVNHVTYVSVASSLLNLLESLLDGLVLLHFLLHLAFQELTPQLLDHEAVALFDLVSILAVVLSIFSNLGLSVNTILALLKGLIFVLNRHLE